MEFLEVPISMTRAEYLSMPKFGEEELVMVRRFVAGLMLLSAFSFQGCTLCCSPYDFDYMSRGSVVQRQDMVRGRLGSTFSDPTVASDAEYAVEEGEEVVVEELGFPEGDRE